MKGFYLLVPVGGRVEIIPHEGPIKLDLLQQKVGDSGVVDVIMLAREGRGRTIDMWVDDEGLVPSHPRWNRELPNGTTLAGTALVCACDAEGDSVPLTEAEARAWAAAISRWRVAIAMPATVS